tara:strand:- start:225 stop:2084 length:1860 start_codon:yes stop_codon:yes gene_type:complete
MAVDRDIKYINRDFNSLRQSLINFTKTYFPTTYNDFSPSSPGMMFMELSSYVGDVLSFYQDNQFQETFIQYAREAKNLYDLAYMMGYKPNVTGVAKSTIDFYQQVPAKETSLGSGNWVPDYDYALLIGENAQITSNINSNIKFLVEDAIDFDVSSSLDPTSVSIYSTTGTDVDYFLLKKSRKAISATINSETFTFTSPQEFSTRTITANNIIGILDIVDSDGNTWYEVNHLGQEMVFDDIKNENTNDPNFSTDLDTPYLLKNKKIQRRFASRVTSNTTLQIQFGAGTTADSDEEVTPNANNVGIGLPFEKDKLTAAYSPQNFIFTNTYGIAPSNTTLTVRYLTGGGAGANIGAGELTTLSNSTINFQTTGLDPTQAQLIFDRLTVSNPEAASGGSDGDSIQEIRQNSLVQFQTQLRNVTADDYLVRSLSMPSKYGAVSKAYIEQTKLNTLLPGEIPSTLTLYILSQDINGNLTNASDALKQNLQTYLAQYRVIGDSINIKNAFYINIGINFDITVRPNFNSNDVLRNCIRALQTYFNLNNWQINEPIQKKEIFLLLDKIQGVQTVKQVTFTNKVGGNYSQYAYDLEGATLNDVIYPSIDPMIFEVKFPNTDIKGKVVNL